MTEQEKEAMEAAEAYKKEGVELPPEAEPKEEEKEPEAEEESKEEEESEEESKEEEEEESEAEEELPEEPVVIPKKRSIYKDLKESRKDLKTEKELREEAEKERDELKVKLEAKADAETPAEAKKADDELNAFAKEIGADPSSLERMRTLFLKDAPQGSLPKEVSEQLTEFQEWQKTNSKAVEEVQFEKEFKSISTTMKELFPKATAEETETIKTELHKLAHTKGFNDKELDYIAFKNKKSLTALVSPKKRGLESKGKGDVDETTTFKFDPNADLTKLSPKALEAWEKDYAKATSSDQLEKDAHGNPIIL